MNAIEKQQELFNQLEVPKWKRAPLPEGLFEQPVAKSQLKIECEHAKVKINPMKALFINPDYLDYQVFWQAQGTHQKSLGAKFESYVSGFSQDAILIVSNARTFEMPKVRLDYFLSEANHNYLIEQLIVVEAGCKLEVILDLSSKDESDLNYFGKTKIVAKAGSQVKVVKIQRLSKNAHAFDMNLSFVEEGGQLEVVDLQIGADYKAISYESELLGKHSRSQMKTAYYGESDQKLDLSFTMTHSGKQSESFILAKGALSEHSQKTFRGNLFFSTGASESVGREQEFVTLLSPNVKSDSFPALMCSEDDVVGEHAASIGQVDTETLFYLMSRGLAELEAKRMIIKASFEEIIREIGDDTLQSLVMEEVDRRLI
jgi:Fe-S cluster assembly protein SufD